MVKIIGWAIFVIGGFMISKELDVLTVVGLVLFVAGLIMTAPLRD